jgi:isopenicillin N synthase-like dioxygenase
MAAASATGGAKLASLPIINIAPWLGNHDGHGRLSTSAALHAACLEYGFFYLDVSEFIDPSEPEELAQLARDFFALPQEEKNKIGLSKQDGARGSVRMFSSSYHVLLIDLTTQRLPTPERECHKRKGR